MTEMSSNSSSVSAFLHGFYGFPDSSRRSLITTAHPLAPTAPPPPLLKRIPISSLADHCPNNGKIKENKTNNASSFSSSYSSEKESKKGFTRRDGMGLAFSLGLLHTILRKQDVVAEEMQCVLTTVAPSGLAFCDRVVGTGPQPIKGQLIKAHYVGKLENGKVFDSSYQRGKPLTFRIGVGEVIKGWDQGILGSDGVPPMLAGGKRTLRLPPELGYGMRGAGCRGGSCIIPPDSVLLFDVEFIGQA